MLSADPAVDRREYMRGNLVYNEVDPLPLMGAILALYTRVMPNSLGVNVTPIILDFWTHSIDSSSPYETMHHLL